MVGAGMTPSGAIVAAASAPLSSRLTDRGTLAPGKRADLLVLDAIPSTTSATPAALRSSISLASRSTARP